MLPALAIAMFLGGALSHGRKIVDFTNDILNNVVSIAGDAHQAKVAQDIFRQEIWYERSLQMRDDIRDLNKLMLESVSSTLFLGSIVLGTCFVTVIEGFPPLSSSRMVVAWWLLFAVWSINYNILAIWFALCFQLKISSSARERLLRRYRYRLPDDGVVARMGGQNLVSAAFQLQAMAAEQLGYLLRRAQGGEGEEDPRAPAEGGEEAGPPRVRAESLDPAEALDCAPLRKGLHAWVHSSGRGRAWPRLIDAPAFLLGETLVRSRWLCRGERPLLLRVYEEATLYLAAQCPPLRGGAGAGGGQWQPPRTLLGVRRAMGADVPEWPAEELPVATAGFHPAWRGPGGHGAFRRVEGYRVLVDADDIELPLYKLVLATPAGGHVDVILHWRFQAGCEALLVVLRKGHVHCKEEDWPMAEFNDEVGQITPLQDYSGLYLRRGIVFLVISVSLSVLAQFWVLGERPMWWLEPALMVSMMLPVLLTIHFMPINIKATQEALSMPVVNRISQADAPAQAAASRGAPKWDAVAGSSTDTGTWSDSPPRIPRRSSGRRHCADGGADGPRAAERREGEEGEEGA
uniref:Uncharacterized protein n=1 Tax=Alexandrium monilatum TaxID=311494 RepID=A0A7S4QJH9_9DINO